MIGRIRRLYVKVDCRDAPTDVSGVSQEESITAPAFAARARSWIILRVARDTPGGVAEGENRAHRKTWSRLLGLGRSSS
jgi:hypothetical protein